jgi:MFS family permease
MWGIPALLFLVAFFHRAAPGVIARDLMQSFGVSSTIVGLLSATYFYGYAGLMLPAGLLIDAFGARKVLAVGGAVMGLGTLAMGAAATPAILFGGRLTVGLGASVTFIGALKIAAAWFPPSRFGTISATTAAVGVFGSLMATTPLAALVALVGWRGAFWIIGLGTVATAVLCGALVRDQPGGDSDAGGPAPRLREVMAGAVEVLRNRHTWPPFLAFFCQWAAFGNLMLWTVPFGRDVYGLTTTEAAFYATATPLALLLSAPVTGFVSDRILGRRKLPYTALAAAACVVWLSLVLTLGALPLAALYGLLFVLGIATSGFGLTWAIGREVNPPRLAGIAVAVTNLGGFLGAALTQGPFGAILDSRWGGITDAGARVYPVEAYRLAFAVCAAFVLASMLVTLLLKETRGRNIHHELTGRADAA